MNNQKDQMARANYLARVLVAVVMVCCLSSGSSAQKTQIRVAAAADLQTVMPEIARAFEAQTGTSVHVVYGSSGNFYAQIQNGAPLDVFFSADNEYTKKIGQTGLAEPDSEVIYALGKIVLWMPAASKCNPERDQWKCLQDRDVKKIAIANPEHAPYGRAAVAALKRAGIHEEIKVKLVYGENISQAAQFAQSGNAQAAILAYSLALSPALRDGKRWEVPAELYPRIEQGAVVLKSSKEKSAAHDFVKFVTQSPGREIMAKFGFELPAAP